ncbi:MAG TPA: hypothetical protein VF529_09665 [Solirubrobacteraceae bacterium]|jgi:hypothetical protein
MTATVEPSQTRTAEIRARVEDGSVPIIELVRSFSVVSGGPAILDAAATASIASTLRAIRRKRRPPVPAVLGVMLTAAYAAVGRPWMRQWGATPAEQRQKLPGDDLVPEPASQSTRAVAINAPASEVWQWLAQIGQDRGGFYSYEWLENLAGCRMHNAETVRHDWQHRDVGERVYLHPLFPLPVTVFEPGRAIALKGWGAFVVEPLDAEHTRLIARERTPRDVGALFYELFMAIPHFVMERKMLLGIKERAERTRAERAAAAV